MSNILIANLNARLQPMHRGEIFEDPLDHQLQAKGIGSVIGGGTMQSKSGEVEYCDIEIEVNTDPSAAAQFIAEMLSSIGAPKGSKVVNDEGSLHVPFGNAEGLAVYLNGTDLPDSTYAECDSNFVYSEFERLLNGIGSVLSYWQGPTETALYMYGHSFSGMHERLKPFIDTYPLCAKARVTQIA